jgi:hypothetical protein
LKQIIADKRAAGSAPPKVQSKKLRHCGAHRMLTIKNRPPSGDLWSIATQTTSYHSS